MNENCAAINQKILEKVDADELRRIDGWEGLEGFADRVAIDRVEINSVEGSETKWSARGIATLHLINWDDEKFGELRLHVIASGHQIGHEVQMDSLVISSHMQ